MADVYNAPVAKACSNCAKAKARCDSSNNNTCSRCHRLGKACAPQQAVRKRRAPRIKRSDQIAQLQETVNNLLSIVGSDQEHPPGFIPSPASIAASSNSRSTLAADDRLTQFVHSDITHAPNPNSTGTPSSLSNIQEPVPFLKNSDILLSKFQDHLAPKVPFVRIPPDVTVAGLHRESPMVYMAIMMAASYNDQQTQQELGNFMLKYLTQKVILEGKKNLDLLQGLLIYISWHQYSCHVNFQTNNLLGLLSAQLVDLGIKRVTAENEVHESFIQIARRIQAHAMPDHGLKGYGRPLSMDEKRAFLGCYYLSSCLSSSSSRLDSLRFPPYIKECCDELTEAREQPTDIQLAYLMRLQSLVEKQRVGGLWESVGSSQNDTLRASTGLLVRSYQLELQNFKNYLPPGYLSNPFFSMNYYAAEIYLYEVGFKLSQTTGVIVQDLESLRLTDILYACFQATRSWFEAYLSIPYAEYYTLTLINFGQLFHAIDALYKLSVFNILEWDISMVRKTLNLSILIGQIASCLEEAKNLYNGGKMVQSCPWTFCINKLRSCKTWWDMTVAMGTDVAADAEVWPEGFNEDWLPFMTSDSLDEYFWQTTA